MIIDFRVVPPPREYIDQDEFNRVFVDGFIAPYSTLYGADINFLSRNPQDMVEEMTIARVDCAVLQGEWGFGQIDKLNDAVYKIAKLYPDKFPMYFMGLNPGQNDMMAKLIERETNERGFSGVNIQPWATRLPINHKAWGPIYAKCNELQIPIAIHTSINFAVDRPMSLGQPQYLSEIASEFPDLVIIANHGGWPWVAEMVGAAWKHKNIYIEIGAQSPKHMVKAGSGWEPLINYGNNILQDKVLFATDSMLPQKRVIEELLKMPLKETVISKWLGLNAKSLLERIRI
jgi:uncharacterized protein